MILSVSCSKVKFSEDKTAGENYDIKIMDSSGDATVAPGTTTASVEGPDAGVDSMDSDTGTGDSGVDTGSDKGNGKGSGKGGDADAGECASATGINKGQRQSKESDHCSWRCLCFETDRQW